MSDDDIGDRIPSDGSNPAISSDPDSSVDSEIPPLIRYGLVLQHVLNTEFEWEYPEGILPSLFQEIMDDGMWNIITDGFPLE